MYWIPLLLLGLNLGGASAAGSGEAAGSQTDPIARLNEFIKAHSLDYVSQMEFVKEQLGGELESEILKAFVALEPIASHADSLDFDCGQENVKNILRRFAKMREVLSETNMNDFSTSRKESSLLIVQSISDMEMIFLDGCIREKFFAQLSQTKEPKHEEALRNLKAFSDICSLSPEKGPYAEQAREISMEETIPIPPVRLSRINERRQDNKMSPEEFHLIFCEQTCGEIDGALKEFLETGLELLEAARSIGLEIRSDEWKNSQIYFHYLICENFRDVLSNYLKPVYDSGLSLLFAEQQN